MWIICFKAIASIAFTMCAIPPSVLIETVLVGAVIRMISVLLLSEQDQQVQILIEYFGTKITIRTCVEKDLTRGLGNENENYLILVWHPAPFHSPHIGLGSKLITTSNSSATLRWREIFIDPANIIKGNQKYGLTPNTDIEFRRIINST